MKTITIEHKVATWNIEPKGKVFVVTLYLEGIIGNQMFTFKTFDEAVNYVKEELL